MKKLLFFACAFFVFFGCNSDEELTPQPKTDSSFQALEKSSNHSTSISWLIQFREDFLKARKNKPLSNTYTNDEICTGIERLTNIYYAATVPREKQSLRSITYDMPAQNTATKINYVYDAVVNQVTTHQTEANYGNDSHLVAVDVKMNTQTGELEVYSTVGSGQQSIIDYDASCDVFVNSPDNCWLVGSGDLDALGAVPDPNLDTNCNGEITGSNAIEEIEAILTQNLPEINGAAEICRDEFTGNDFAYDYYYEYSIAYSDDVNCDKITLQNPYINSASWNVGEPCGSFFGTLDGFAPNTELSPVILNCMYCLLKEDLDPDFTPQYLIPPGTIILDPYYVPVSINMWSFNHLSGITSIEAEVCWASYECEVNRLSCEELKARGLPCPDMDEEYTITTLDICDIIPCADQ